MNREETAPPSSLFMRTAVGLMPSVVLVAINNTPDGALLLPGCEFDLLLPDGSGESTAVPFEGPQALLSPRQLMLGARWSF